MADYKALNIATRLDVRGSGKSFNIMDETPVYDSEYPNGYGGDSGSLPIESDIDKITLEIDTGTVQKTLEYLKGSSEFSDYFDRSEGLVISVSDIFGSGYTYFEDGIYKISITYSGDTIDGSSVDAWEAYDVMYSAFLWNLWEDIRMLTANIETPVVNLLESYNISLLNALFDSITYLCQYGRADEAEEVRSYVQHIVSNNTIITELFKNVRYVE